MDIYDVVNKLAGSITPVGETNCDEIRFKNLKVVVNLVDRLLYDITIISSCKDRCEHSMQKAGKFADEFIKDIKEA